MADNHGKMPRAAPWRGMPFPHPLALSATLSTGPNPGHTLPDKTKPTDDPEVLEEERPRSLSPESLCPGYPRKGSPPTGPGTGVWALCVSAVSTQHAEDKQNVAAAGPNHPTATESWADSGAVCAKPSGETQEQAKAKRVPSLHGGLVPTFWKMELEKLWNQFYESTGTDFMNQKRKKNGRKGGREE